jgi:hypothetical protein
MPNNNRASALSVGGLSFDSRPKSEIEPTSEGLKPSSSMQSLATIQMPSKPAEPRRSIVKIPGPPPTPRPADALPPHVRTNDIKIDTPSTISPDSVNTANLTTVVSEPIQELSPTLELTNALSSLRSMIEKQTEPTSILLALESVVERVGSVEAEVQRLSKEVKEKSAVIEGLAGGAIIST